MRNTIPINEMIDMIPDIVKMRMARREGYFYYKDEIDEDKNNHVIKMILFDYKARISFIFKLNSWK